VHILLSNDDGYNAPGLVALQEAIAQIAQVTIVAPDRNRSGASNSLTLHRPVRCHRMAEQVYATDGTPTDCVHIALTALLDHPPDMVVSGVNAGANLGDDVIYSGTVAAAMEGRFLGLPAMAVSLASHTPTHFATAARVAQTLVKRLQAEPLPADTILNVNVPDLPWEQLQGYATSRLSRRHRTAPVIADQDPRGLPIYWIGPVANMDEADPDTDSHAVNHGLVSVTPVQVDLTRYEAMDRVAGWLQGGTR
jgi:5'-nucleotidase